MQQEIGFLGAATPRRGSNLLADPTPGPGLGSNPVADPTPGPGWGDPGRRRGQKSFFVCFFLLFPRKKLKKKQKKKTDLGGPPLPDEGVPQVSSHLHHLPGWSSQKCKVSPKPSQSSCAQAPCHDPRHTLSSASSKSGMTLSAKATPGSQASASSASAR